MLSSACKPYGRSLLRTREFRKVDERDRDRHLNIINKTTTSLSDRNLESENSFPTNAPRVVIQSI